MTPKQKYRFLRDRRNPGQPTGVFRYVTLLKRLLTPLAVAAAVSAAPQSAREPIAPDNIGRLAVAWTYDTRDRLSAAGGSKRPAFEATPVYTEGRLYSSTPQGTVRRSTPRRDRECGVSTSTVGADANYSDPRIAGPRSRGDQLYVGTVDARLVCLSARRQALPGFGRDGQIDLTAGLRRRPQYRRIRCELAARGLSRSRHRRLVRRRQQPRADGVGRGPRLRRRDRRAAVDVPSLPADAQAGGANTWSRIVVDEANGLVFLPTGSASPDYFGGLRPGSNGYANSIVALRAATGKVAWHFQTVHHDLWDYDVASPPLLYPGKSGPGRGRRARRQATCSCSTG